MAACTPCKALRTGYRGRVPVLEWLRLDAGQREQWRKGGPTALQPRQSLLQAGRELVNGGATDAAEFERVFSR